MVGITRINRLYNSTIRTKKDRKAKRPPVFRPGLFGVAKTAFYENFVLKDESDPFIPGTDVPRLKLLHLAETSSAAFDDEIERVQEGLRRWRDKTFAEGLPRKQIGKPKTTVERASGKLKAGAAEHTT